MALGLRGQYLRPQSPCACPVPRSLARPGRSPGLTGTSLPLSREGASSPRSEEPRAPGRPRCSASPWLRATPSLCSVWTPRMSCSSRAPKVGGTQAGPVGSGSPSCLLPPPETAAKEMRTCSCRGSGLPHPRPPLLAGPGGSTHTCLLNAQKRVIIHVCTLLHTRPGTWGPTFPMVTVPATEEAACQQLCYTHRPAWQEGELRVLVRRLGPGFFPRFTCPCWLTGQWVARGELCCRPGPSAVPAGPLSGAGMSPCWPRRPEAPPLGVSGHLCQPWRPCGVWVCDAAVPASP